MSKVYKSGEPCSHPGCERHLSHPCEICGRIGAQGEIEIKGIVIEYDKPGKDGNIYKKGCFDSVNKIVDIKHDNETVGKGKIIDKENGIFIEGYVTESEIKGGVRIIKDFEIKGISVSGFNEREAREYEEKPI